MDFNEIATSEIVVTAETIARTVLDRSDLRSKTNTTGKYGNERERSGESDQIISML